MCTFKEELRTGFAKFAKLVASNFRKMLSAWFEELKLILKLVILCYNQLQKQQKL